MATKKAVKSDKSKVQAKSFKKAPAVPKARLNAIKLSAPSLAAGAPKFKAPKLGKIANAKTPKEKMTKEPKISKKEMEEQARVQEEKLLAEKKKLEKKTVEKYLPHFNGFVSEFFGEEGLAVVSGITDCGCTDETIEKKSQLKMPEIRAMLNRLHNYGIVEYSREKNLESGWFTYTWRINYSRAAFNFLQQKKRQLEDLQTKNSTQTYKCKRGCTCFEFDQALEQQFKCPVCESLLNAETIMENPTEKVQKHVEVLSRMAQELI